MKSWPQAQEPVRPPCERSTPECSCRGAPGGRGADSRRLPGARSRPGPGRGPPRAVAEVLDTMSISRPAGRGPPRTVGGVLDSVFLSVVSGTGSAPAFFSPFLLVRRAALREFVLAVVFWVALLIFMLKGSRPARRLLPGAAGQCFEVAEVVAERGGTIALIDFGGKTRASRKEKVLGGSEERVHWDEEDNDVVLALASVPLQPPGRRAGFGGLVSSWRRV